MMHRAGRSSRAAVCRAPAGRRSHQLSPDPEETTRGLLYARRSILRPAAVATVHSALHATRAPLTIRIRRLRDATIRDPGSSAARAPDQSLINDQRKRVRSPSAYVLLQQVQYVQTQPTDHWAYTHKLCVQRQSYTSFFR
jgi:hypothetical protein